MEDIIEAVKEVIGEVELESKSIDNHPDQMYYIACVETMKETLAAFEAKIVPKFLEAKGKGFEKDFGEGIVNGFKRMRDTVGFLLKEKRDKDV